MARKSRFKLFLVLLVLIPVFTLCMVFGVEWSYVEQLRDKEMQKRETRGRFSNKVDLHQRSPLENVERDVDEPLRDVLEKRDVYMKQGRNDGHRSLNEPSLINNRRGRLLVTNKTELTTLASKPLPLNEVEMVHEALRERKIHKLRVEKSMRELWWYLRDHLTSGSPSAGEDLLRRIQDQYDALRVHFEELENQGHFNDGANEVWQLNWQYWQKKLSIDVTQLMQKRLAFLQNPPDCSKAKKLICQVAKPCGFGCQIHHASFCFIMAYATKRTLILDSHSWRYAPGGWNTVFQPLSSTCKQYSGPKDRFSFDSEAIAIFLSPVDNLSQRVSQLPMAIPRDLADRLMAFHGAPFVWFMSQFLHYLMRPCPELQDYLSTKRNSIGLPTNHHMHPIVGIHVRRTDKRTEARYHEIKEYMEQVDEWYQWYELSHRDQLPITRRLYIATDEPTVLQEAKKMYPQYEIHSDAGISSVASKTSTRYSTESLYGVIFDVTMLSECDYIVCTFSSQVCRVAYELMQSRHIDASQYYYSLDDVYYFGGQQGHNVVAIQDNSVQNNDNSDSPSKHRRRGDELNFQTGDRLGIAGNEKDGFSVGMHIPTQKRGKFPSYKVEEDVLIADFPTYNEVS